MLDYVKLYDSPLKNSNPAGRDPTGGPGLPTLFLYTLLAATWRVCLNLTMVLGGM